MTMLQILANITEVSILITFLYLITLVCSRALLNIAARKVGPIEGTTLGLLLNSSRLHEFTIVTKTLINNPSFNEFVVRTNRNKAETVLVPILEHASATGAEVDLQDLFKRFAFDCTCTVVLGHDPASLSHDLPDLPHEKAFADMEEAILYRQAKQSIRQFISHCMSVKHQELMDGGDDDDNLDMLTVYTRDQQGTNNISRINDIICQEVWKDYMLNFLSAGKDTISAGLSWFFWLLATNPAEEAKIRQEILTNFPIGNSEEELKKLIYLHAALCEGIKNEPSFKFPAFNAGPRSCLGKDMSFVEMKIVAVALLSRFRFQVVEGHPVSPSTSIVLHMKRGLKVKVSNYV